MRRIAFLLPLVSVWLASTMTASAGMTVITLTDLAKSRLDALSFFIVLYLLISWVVKLLWNHLQKTFTALPKLDYKRALALVFLSGLLFYVVLTMISGAREVLTPGVWEKQGVGYRQRVEGAPSGELSKQLRREALLKLKEQIWAYAEKNEGKAPAGPFVDGIELDAWKFPGGGLYCLMPDVKPGVGRDVLIYEPSAAGPRRMVLLGDGSIEDRSEGVLKTQLDEQLNRE